MFWSRCSSFNYAFNRKLAFSIISTEHQRKIFPLSKKFAIQLNNFTKFKKKKVRLCFKIDFDSICFRCAIIYSKHMYLFHIFSLKLSVGYFEPKEQNGNIYSYHYSRWLDDVSDVNSVKQNKNGSQPRNFINCLSKWRLVFYRFKLSTLYSDV